MLFSATGAGALVLGMAGWLKVLPSGEKWCVALALGVGSIGWLAFWPGMVGLLTPLSMLVGIILLIPANFLLLSSNREQNAVFFLGNTAPNVNWCSLAIALAAIGIAIFVLDVLEALAPPIEADTLAYHFDLPDFFADEGKIVFVPRALTGAIPLLMHMTYTIAAVIGKFSWLDVELMLMLWVLFTGWGGAITLFFLARRWLSPAWALSLALVYQTMPTFIYGAGSGQVEARLGLFVIAAIIVFITNYQSDKRGAMVLLGTFVGFYVASKYTGLIFAIAFGGTLFVTIFRRSTRNLVIAKDMFLFTATAVAAGGQWYLWNFIHTGDPVFPMLFRWVGSDMMPYWSTLHDAHFRAVIALRGTPIGSFFEKVMFPWSATFTPIREIDSGRVGLGPFVLVILPLSLYAAWINRRKAFVSPLLPALTTLLLFYLLWLQFGGIPKVRHISPIVGPVIVILFVSALQIKAFRLPLAFSVIAVLCLQVGVQVVYVKSAAQRLIMGEGRDQYLTRVIGDDYRVIKWINNHAKEIPHLLISDREFNFQIKTRTTFVHHLTTGILDLREGHVYADSLWRGVCKLGVSHVLNPRENAPSKLTMAGQYPVLEKRGLMVRLKTFKTKPFVSRTLKLPASQVTVRSVWRVKRHLCA